MTVATASNEASSAWRWAVVASHVFALPALLVAYTHVTSMWLEFYVYAAGVAASVANHLAWSYGEELLGVPAESWHRFDVFFTNASIVATLVWVAFPLGDPRRYALVALLLVPVATGAAYDEPLHGVDGVPVYLATLAAPYFAAMAVLGFWRNLYPRGIAAALLFAAVGSAALLLGDAERDHYVLLHSSWHVLIYGSLYAIVSARRGQAPVTALGARLRGGSGGGLRGKHDSEPGQLY